MQINRLITIMIGLLFSFQATADEEGKEYLRKANAHYEVGNYDIAVSYYMKAAELDETEAQFDLGYALYHGEGIQQDYSSAAMWFKRAANNHYPKAEYNLAFCYMYGKGVPCDYEKAQQLLFSSASSGFRDAQITLAECYEHGILVEQNIAESQRWKNLAEGKKQTAGTSNIGSSGTIPPVFDIQLDGALNERQTAQRFDMPLYTKAEKSQSAPPKRNAIVIQAPNKKATKSEPAIKILFPTDNSTFHTDVVKVKYQLIADEQEDSTSVIVMVDGVEKKRTAIGSAGLNNMMEVEVPGKDCTITLYAQNRAGRSKPTSVRLVQENINPNSEARLFCIAVGVDGSAKAARDFSRAVQKKQGFPYPEIQIKLLTDKEATRADLAEALEWLQQESRPNDICIFYYAGNGYRDIKDLFYFIPYGGSEDKLYNCLSAIEFREMTNNINCKTLVFADVICKADQMNHISTTSHFAEQLKRQKKGMLLYASSIDESKSKGLFKSSGNFTKALITAFNDGARQPADKALTSKALGTFLMREVQRSSSSYQAPIFLNPDGMPPFNIFTYEN